MDLFSLVSGVARSLFGGLRSRRRAVRRGQSLLTGQALENRVLLATLVSATKLTYQDKDGDNVEVTFSKPIPSVAVANQIFTFDSGPGGVNGSNTTKQQLRSINLANLTQAAGTTIITKAVRSAATGGDGFAAIGQIDATGIDIGAVTIDGDLGRILAGDATTTTQGLGALKVHSLGRFGLFTGATNLTSTIQGAVASLTTKTDVREANFRVQGGANGKLAAVTIGGSLIGGAASQSGRILSDGNMGPVKITGDVVGGGGSLSGTVQSQSNLTSIAIGGSLIGGSGNNSGFLSSGAAMGAVTITGSVLGGAGAESGWILSPGTLASVTVGGSVVAGVGPGSGAITSEGNLGAVKVTGDVVGSAGTQSGRIASAANLASVTIGGSLIGSSGQASGQVFSTGTLGPVVITGDVRGGSFAAANETQATGAVVSNANITSVTIGGSLIGGAGGYSGLLVSGLGSGPLKDMGAVKITGDVRGGGLRSGRILSQGKLLSVTIGGSLIGGSGLDSGSVSSQSALGAVQIVGNVIGGSGGFTGLIKSASTLASVTIGGSLLGGSSNFSGLIDSNGGDLGAVNIKGDVFGGSADFSGGIESSGKLASVTIGGSLIGSSGLSSGKVFSNGTLGPVVITGDVRGGSFNAPNDTQATGAVVSNASIASVSIGGSLIGGLGDRSGRLASGLGTGPLKDLGAVKITGDVRGGSGFGSGRIQSNDKLASVTIGGSLIGGSGQSSGKVFSGGTLGPVVITGDLRGGSFEAPNKSQATGAVVSDASIASVTIGGSLIGGAGAFSGLLASGGLGGGTLKDMGAVKITGDVRGGGGASSGRIQSNGKLASVTIGGSLIGGSGELLSGSIEAVGELTTLTITGDIRGGSASGSGELVNSGYVQASRIATLTLGGSLIAGVDTTIGTFYENGAIRVAHDIASLTIKGSVVGNSTNRAIITTRGQLTPAGTTDLAIGKLTINGRVEHALIQAGGFNGVGISFIPLLGNADAQIGPVIVGGDWIASDLVAGAAAGADTLFGTADDAKLPGVNGVSGFKDIATVFSKITSIVIGGQAFSTPGAGDHFGFVAQNIGSFKVKAGVTTFPMLAGNSNDDHVIGLFGDLRVNEI